MGFGLSTLLLALASVVMIPAMIAAGGVAVWGAIALGQTIGAVAAVATLYGWGWYGPAKIVRATGAERRVEYLESAYTRVTIAIPASGMAAGVSHLLSPTAPHFAAAGAVSSAVVGLTAQWYFAGADRPLTFLALETLPRVGGAALGIALMHLGHSAIVGPISMLAGIVAGFALCSIWVLLDTRQWVREASPRRNLMTILAENRHGMMAALGGAATNAAPLGIVSLIAPFIQPVFALLYRLFRQMITAFIPAVVVLQGWVPRGTESARVQRANMALVAASLLAIIIGGITLISAPHLLNWLGEGQVSASWTAMALMSACVSIALFETILSRSVLATFDLLKVCVRGVGFGAAVGLPVVALGAYLQSVTWALFGVVLTLLTMVAIEFIEYVRVVLRAD